MSDKYTSQDLQDNLDYLNETKSLIKQAIIDKEQLVSDNDTFRSYADKIRAIETGINTTDATATPSDILAPKTAYTSEGKITGTIIPDYSILSANVQLTDLDYQGINVIDIHFEAGLAVAYYSTSQAALYRIVNNQIDTSSMTLFNLPHGSDGTQPHRGGMKFASKKLNENEILLMSGYGEGVELVGMCKININTLEITQLGSISGWVENGNNWPIHRYTISAVPNTTNQFVYSGLGWGSTGKWLRTNVATVRFDEATSTISKKIDILTGQVFNTVIHTGDVHLFNGFSADGLQCALTIIPHTDGRFASLYLRRNSLDDNFALVHTAVDNVESYKPLSNNFVFYDGNVYDKNDLTTPVSSYNFSMTGMTPVYILLESDPTYFIKYDIPTSYWKLYSIDTDGKITFLQDLSQWGGLSNSYNDWSNIIINNSELIAAYDKFKLKYIKDQLMTNEKILTAMTKDNVKFHYLHASNGTTDDVLSGVKVYTDKGLITGTMPNNGALNYTPSDEEYIIPAGYTSGGTISGVNIETLEDYNKCLDLSEQILNSSDEGSVEE